MLDAWMIGGRRVVYVVALVALEWGHCGGHWHGGWLGYGTVGWWPSLGTRGLVTVTARRTQAGR